MDAIASFLVLPNRLTVPLVANLHVAQLRSPLPRVTLHCALMEYLTMFVILLILTIQDPSSVL